jgi:hypothetical protein
MTLELIDVKEAADVADMTFLAGFDPAKYKSYLLRCDHLIETNPTVLGPQFVLTFSSDGTTFDDGSNYFSTIGYECNAFAPIDPPNDPTNPYRMYAAHYRLMSTGIFLGLDNPGMMSQGYSADLIVRSPGVVGGRNVDTVVDGLGSRGTSATDPMPFGHINFGRWTGALGSQVKGIRIFNNQQNFSGRVELWGYSSAASSASPLRSAYVTTSRDMALANGSIDVPVPFKPKSIRFQLFYNGMSATGDCDETGAGGCTFQVTKCPPASLIATSNPIVGASDAENYVLGTVTPTEAGFSIAFAKGGTGANPTGLLTIAATCLG